MTGAAVTGAEPVIGLLGPIVVYGGDGPLMIRGVKQQLLLSLLALSPGRTVSTDLLVDALWGDRPPPSAQTALRVHIARLRESLTVATPRPEIVHRPPGYALVVPPECIDWVQFSALLNVTGESGPGDARRRLDAALSLWRGEPYGGLSENELLRIEAGRLRELHETALEDHADALLRSGDHQAAASELEALVRAEPLRERRTRLLMTALYRDGRQAGALNAYKNLRKLLATDLGLEPSPELRATQRAVLEQDQSLVLAQPAESLSALTASRTANLPWWIEKALKAPMFGRERMLDQLVENVQGANLSTEQDPGLQVLLLHGEPGVGKSRLLAELARRVMGRGVRVLAGWCDPEGIIPFRPITEAFRTLAHEGPAQVWPSSVTAAADRIARYFSDFDTGPPRADPETDRLRYFEGVANLVREASSYYPLLLVIDDIHWLDPSSAALLRHLMRQPAHHSFVLAAGYRSDRAEHTSAWSRTLAELRRSSSCSLVEVTELSPDATIQLIGDVFDDTGHARTQRLASRLLPITGGNPLFVREVALQLRATGALGDPYSPIPLPTTILADVSGRIGRLTTGAHEVIDLAAVLGAEFTLDDLASVAGRPPDSTLAALDEARQARLIDEVPNALDRFAFRHALLREAVHDLMPRSRRLRAHLAAGMAYEGRDDMTSVLAKAFHLIEAVPICRPETAARACVDAADVALARLAFEEAIRVLSRALDLAETDLPVSDITKFDLLMRLGRACSYRGETSASESAFSAAADVARSCHDPIRLATAALGDNLDTRPLTTSSSRLELLDEALRAIPDASPLHVAVASTYVALASLTIGPASVQTLSEETIDAARRTHDPVALSKALLARLTCTNGTATPEERLAVSTEAVELAEATGDSSRAARARLIRLGILLRLGRLNDALDDYSTYRDLAESTRVPRHLWHADVVAAALSRLRGDFAEAQEHAERAMQTGEKFEVAEARMVYSVHLFFIHLHRGTLAELRPAAAAHAAARPDLISWKLSAALAARAAADLVAAKSTLDQFVDMLPDLDTNGEWWSAQLMQAAQLAEELDADPAVADRLWEPLSRRSGEFAVFGATTATLGPVDRALGGLAALRGDPDRAAQLFTDAMAQCERMQAWPWWVWAGADLANHLMRHRRRADARAIAETVVPRSSALGMLGQTHRLTAI